MSVRLTAAFIFGVGRVSRPTACFRLLVSSVFSATAAPNQGGGFIFDGLVFHDLIGFVELTALCVLCKGSPESGRPLFTTRLLLCYDYVVFHDVVYFYVTG